MEKQYAGPSLWLSGRVIYPILAILAACFIAAAGVLLYFADELDLSERRHSVRFTASVLEEKTAALERTILDYAAWGELYTHMHGRIDVDWAYTGENLGGWLSEQFGYDTVMLFGPDGHEAYTVLNGTYSPTPAGGRIADGLAQLLEKARDVPANESVAVSGIASVGGDPILLAAAAVSTGSDPSVTPVDGPPSILVFGQRLTPETLREMGEAMFVRELRGRLEAPGPADNDAVSLPTIDGAKRWIFEWTPEARGELLADRLLPILAITGLLVAAIVAALLRQAFRASLAAARAGAELVHAHSDAEFRALHDAATGLPNRLHMMRFLETTLARKDNAATLFFVDLDRFKPVNDSLGHQAGDTVLAEVARRLSILTPKDGLAARVGGDEFVVVAPGLRTEGATQLSGQLLAAVTEPIVWEGSEIAIGASIGIARSPMDASEAGELIRLADIALYQAKNEGRGTARFFTPEMNDRIMQRRRLEIDLRRAVREQEFVLHFQPRVDARTLDNTGVEALVRWKHPEFGLLPPSAFLAVAEEIGLIVPLGEWVLMEACKAVAPLGDLCVSVNVSPAQFVSEGLARAVQESLRATGMPARRLELELTESVLLQDTVRARQTLERLKQIGVRLSMDDFGTGYSSIGYLRAFPFDTVKIDRQFIGDLDKDKDARSVVQAIVGLGRALDLAVVAEGVETPEQLVLLQADRCREVQGFLTGAPMPLDDFRMFIAKARDSEETADDATVSEVLPLHPDRSIA